MRYLFVGCLAIGLALLWDRLLFNLGIKFRDRVCIGVPFGEEIIKIFLCRFFHLAPMNFYAVFGFGEGLYEMIRQKKPFDLLLLGAGIFTHWSFSLFFLLRLPVIMSLSLAVISHMLWNHFIISSDKRNIG